MNIAEELEKLNNLKERNVISQEEFYRAKNKLLDTDKTANIIISSSNSQINGAAVDNNVNNPARKSVFVAFILCLCFGWAGLHRFYTGYPFSGAIYMLTFGLFGIGWLLDFIAITFGWYRDANDNELV